MLAVYASEQKDMQASAPYLFKLIAWQAQPPKLPDANALPAAGHRAVKPKPTNVHGPSPSSTATDANTQAAQRAPASTGADTADVQTKTSSADAKATYLPAASAFARKAEGSGHGAFSVG